MIKLSGCDIYPLAFHELSAGAVLPVYGDSIYKVTTTTALTNSSQAREGEEAGTCS